MNNHMISKTYLQGLNPLWLVVPASTIVFALGWSNLAGMAGALVGGIGGFVWALVLAYLVRLLVRTERWQVRLGTAAALTAAATLFTMMGGGAYENMLFATAIETSPQWIPTITSGPLATQIILYFIVLNSLMEVILVPLALLLNWPFPKRRAFVLAAALIFYALRIWTYLYFAPQYFDFASMALAPALIDQLKTRIVLDTARFVLQTAEAVLFVLAALVPLTTTAASAGNETQPFTPPAAKRGALSFIFGIVLLDVVGLTMLMPVSAYIVRAYSADALSVTMLTVIYAAAQFVAAPLLGRLSDRHGRRPVLLVCVVGSAVGYALFGIGGALWVLFLSRLIGGITGGNLSVVNAYVADITAPEDRARRFGMIGAAFGAGFVLGPALGGALSQISLAAPAYAAGVLALLNFLLGFFALPESLPTAQRDRQPLRLRDANPLASLADFARRPALGVLLLVHVLFNFAFNGRNALFAVFAIESYYVTPTDFAMLLVVAGIASIIVQGVLVGRLVPRWGEKALVSVSLLAQAPLFVLTYLASAYWMQYPVMVVSMALAGLVWPTLGALIANQVPPQEQGRIAGVTTALTSLMSVVGPLWAGAFYDHVSHGAPFWTWAIGLVIAWLLMLRVRPSVLSSDPTLQTH